MLVSEVKRVPGRRRSMLAMFAVGTVVGGAALAVVLGTRTVAPVLSPPPIARVITPAPAPVAPDPIDEPLVQLAAASAAPVIAVASAHHVWISRDDGRTFARALAGKGSVASLVVEPTGRVYVKRFDLREERKPNDVVYVSSVDELGIAEPDGRERWREVTDGVTPVAAHDGEITGLGSGGGVEIGRDTGASWDVLPAFAAWNTWLVSRHEQGAVRVLASRSLEDDRIDPVLSLLVARDGKPARDVWHMRLTESVLVPTDELPCMAFVGPTLYMVTTDRRAGAHGTRLVRVGGDGGVRARALGDLVGGVVLDPGVTCQIAGNEHAAYLTLDGVVFRIDAREPTVSHHVGQQIDDIAVDAHGDLLVRGPRCVHRFHADGRREDELVCGPRAKD